MTALAGEKVVETRKLVVMIMNCAVQEIARFLLRSPAFNKDYYFQCFPNFGDDIAHGDQVRNVLQHVAMADVLIVQNVKSTEWLRNDNLAKHTKKDCHLIRLTFWRFDGFWPIYADRKTESFWYVSNEVPAATRFSDYINHDIPAAVVQTHFEKEVEKFRAVDGEADFSMMSFFEQNYRQHNLFSDAWHPTAYFYRHVTEWILRQLDISDVLPMLPNNCINRDRYRLVFNSVFSHLDLSFDPTYLHFFENVVSREVWYEFSRYADGRLSAASVQEARNLFLEWRDPETIQSRDINIAIGKPAEQSSRSERSHGNDPLRAVSGHISGQFAMHTQVEPEPWWFVDLREFRQLTRLVIWNGDEGNLWLRAEATPMKILVSDDGACWKDLAYIGFPFSGKGGNKPLVLDFADPVTMRFIKVQLVKTVALRLDQVEAFMTVLVKA